MRVGVLGNGSIGSRHIRNAMDLGHDVRSYDSANRNQTQEDKRSIIEWADKIVIATPTDRHLYDIIECKTAKKPMFVEKPVAHAQSDVLTNEYVKMVGYNLRFHPLIRTIKRAIDDGKIGTPVWANLLLGQLVDPNRRQYATDGVILNWSHEIDLALHLLGQAQFKGANIRRTQDASEDIADLLLTHLSGCRSSVHLDYVSNPWVRCGTIVGDKDYITYDLEIGYADVCGTVTSAGRSAFETSYFEEIRAFLNDVPGTGCTATEAVEVLDICMKAKAA